LLFLIKMCLSSSVPYFIAKSMHVEFAFDSTLKNIVNTIAMTQFTTTITGMVPIPGASGASEIVFQLMFAKFFINCPQTTMSAIILIWRGVTFYLGLILGCIVFFAYHEKPSSSEAFKGDPKRTLLELQVINVGNEKTKTIELAALSTPTNRMEPELLTVEEIEQHFEEVKKDLANILERNDRAVNKENRKRKRSSNTNKKASTKKKTTVVNILDEEKEEKKENETSASTQEQPVENKSEE
ncbi:MAG: YbhN family protein, partial [Bacilli bacterium]